MSLIFSIEPLVKCWNEYVEVSSLHWKETEEYRHGYPYNPSFDRYNQYDKAGWFFMVTVRDNEKLVGYAGIYLTPSMYTQRLIATEDTVFLLPEYRKGRNAFNLYKFIEKESRVRGAEMMGATTKLSNGAGRILEYLGFKPISYQFFKNLTDNADSVNPESLSNVNVEEHAHAAST